MFLEDQFWSVEEWLTEEPDRGACTALPGEAPASKPLTRLEQTVVAMSLFDHVSSIATPGAPMRWITRLLGLRPANRLSDRRLETLRRYCILLRSAGGPLADEEVGRMRDADFSERALDQVNRLIPHG